MIANKLFTFLLALSSGSQTRKNLATVIEIGALPPKTLKVLYHSQHFAIVDKPPLVPCHAYESPVNIGKRRYPQQEQNITTDTVLQRAYATFPNCTSIHLVNRLDVPTSGCLVLAFSSDAAREMQNSMGTSAKTYYAICRGDGFVLTNQGTIQATGDVKNSKGNYKNAKTVVECLCGSENPPGIPRCCLVKAELSTTGRWHQIRQHLGRLNHPIVMETIHHADRKYNREWKNIWNRRGASQESAPRLCLHCHRIQIRSLSSTAAAFLPPEGIDVSCPLQQDMKSIIQMTDWAKEAQELVPELFR